MQGQRIGERIIRARKEAAAAEPRDQGSIMVIVATDLPVSDRQLKRILRRCAVGLARVGSYLGHGSGDIVLGFTTANRMTDVAMDAVLCHHVLTERTLERAFFAVAEATEEAVLNSMIAASPARAADGTFYDSLANWL